MKLIAPTRPLGRREFIALVAMMIATVAYSIDAILPAMGYIVQDLTPEAPVHAQHVVPFFVIGLGVGTLFSGPLSDAFGRRPVVLGGVILYLIGSVLCWAAPSLETLLLARMIQGLGASGPRVVGLAIIRDQFQGREMAQITSFIMMIFTLVPAIAPSIGAGLIYLGSWHGICASFLVFELIVGLWFYLRQPESLPIESRQTLNPGRLFNAVKEVISHSVVRRVVMIQVCVFGMLFTLLSVAQPLFDVVLGMADTFHLWLGAIAFIAMLGAMLNAKLVMRYGMQRIARSALLFHVFATALYVGALETNIIATTNLAAVFLWMALSFAMVGMVISNLNAVAMEPMGHLAGTASSVITAAGTVGGGILAVQAGHLFHDSQTPVLIAILAMVLVARLLLAGRVFRPEPTLV